MSRMRGAGRVAAAFAAFVAMAPAAHAQSFSDYGYCSSLQAQYQDALQRAGGAGMSGQQMVQIDQVSQALAQAQTAAQRYGCNDGGFLGQLFGIRQSPQCPAIRTQINRLSRQLSQLRGNDVGFFGFGSSPQYDVARLRDQLQQNGCSVPFGGGYRTLCVRSCDGYYFPIEYSASSSRFQADAAACQSMYAQAGEAQLFVQSNVDDVANATSLSGERYGDQPYAFLYRNNLVPACVKQLHDGLAALAQRYYSQVPAQVSRAPTIVTPVPRPLARLPASEDPETLADAAGGFTIRPVAPAVAMSDVPAKKVRMVGPAYYADLFDLSKARKKQELLHPAPAFTLVAPADAAEAPSKPPPVD